MPLRLIESSSGFPSGVTIGWTTDGQPAVDPFDVGLSLFARPICHVGDTPGCLCCGNTPNGTNLMYVNGLTECYFIFFIGALPHKCARAKKHGLKNQNFRSAHATPSSPFRRFNLYGAFNYPRSIPRSPAERKQVHEREPDLYPNNTLICCPSTRAVSHASRLKFD